MRYITTFLITTLIVVSMPFKVSAYSAVSMVLIEKSTGEVLQSIDCDARLPMASTTKIMTALVVLQNADLDVKVEIPDEAVGVEGSSMYLKRGETLTVRELLYGLMLTSGNDAATALAIAVGGNEQTFVGMMNSAAKDLGLKNTNFKNPSGLPDDEHYTTAHELAVITSFALDNPVFCEIICTKSIKISNGHTLTNHNKLLSMYEGAIGVKTGFTKKAGRCLVGAATRNGITLICVTLNDGNDWNDHISAFDYGFSVTRKIKLCDKDSFSVPLKTANGKTVYASNRNCLELVTTLQTEITRIIKAEQFVYAPKSTGDTVGEIVFMAGDKELARDELYLTENIDSPPAKKQLFITRIINKIKNFFKRN